MITESEMLEAAASILVVNDLFQDVINEADAHTTEQAIVMLATVDEVIAKAKEARAALCVHLTSEMELYEPVNFKGISYVVKRKKEQVRFDHGAIAGVVQTEAMKRAVDPETGEVSAHTAVREAVQLMRDVFLSPSDNPRINQLGRLGILRKDVETKTLGDKYVDAIPLQAGDQSAREDT